MKCAKQYFSQLVITGNMLRPCSHGAIRSMPRARPCLPTQRCPGVLSILMWAVTLMSVGTQQLHGHCSQYDIHVGMVAFGAMHPHQHRRSIGSSVPKNIHGSAGSGMIVTPVHHCAGNTQPCTGYRSDRPLWTRPNTVCLFYTFYLPGLQNLTEQIKISCRCGIISVESSSDWIFSVYSIFLYSLYMSMGHYFKLLSIVFSFI